MPSNNQTNTFFFQRNVERFFLFIFKSKDYGANEKVAKLELNSFSIPKHWQVSHIKKNMFLQVENICHTVKMARLRVTPQYLSWRSRQKGNSRTLIGKVDGFPGDGITGSTRERLFSTWSQHYRRTCRDHNAPRENVRTSVRESDQTLRVNENRRFKREGDDEERGWHGSCLFIMRAADRNV